MKDKAIKTNAMRLLSQAKIEHKTLYYDLAGEAFSGAAVSEALGMAPERSFKTLCARGEKKGVAVFVVPVDGELSLKAAARALGDKAVTLVHVKELLDLTGYERGSVSPIGMKKRYPVFLDDTMRAFDEIGISGGMKGVTLLLRPDALSAYLGATFAPLKE